MTVEACDRCLEYEAEVRLRTAFVCRPCAELAHNTGVEWSATDKRLRQRRELEYNVALIDRLILEKALKA